MAAILLCSTCTNDNRVTIPDAGTDGPGADEGRADVAADVRAEQPETAVVDLGAAGLVDGNGNDGQDIQPCPGICNAATPRNPTITAEGGSGNITMYTTEASDGGACNYGKTGVRFFAASNVNVAPGDGNGHWKGGRICGQCIEVTSRTSRGPASVVVRIMDKCPDGACGMDLGGDAPAAIMLDGFGRYDGTWRFVSCDGHPEVSDGPPTLVVVEGSNAWWSRLRVHNPPWPVTSITWQDPAAGIAGELPWAADPENAFEVPRDVLQAQASSLAITIHYTDGSVATATVAPTDLGRERSAFALH